MEFVYFIPIVLYAVYMIGYMVGWRHCERKRGAEFTRLVDACMTDTSEYQATASREEVARRKAETDLDHQRREVLALQQRVRVQNVIIEKIRQRLPEGDL